ncbi:MAG: GTP pyrophosphokinase family protein [Spirochaetaceae bacterium]
MPLPEDALEAIPEDVPAYGVDAATREALLRLRNRYRFALQEISTRVDILKQEFETMHEYSPIHHVSERVKSLDSILCKSQRRGLSLTIETIRESVRDIVGIRVSCSFMKDIYRVAGMLVQQDDLEVVEYKDYIEHPKQSGYRSLHFIVLVPVHLSDRVERMYVEVQLRTVAMDFWASLEHKIYYKYDNDVPEHLLEELRSVAGDVDRLDRRMEYIHGQMQERKLTDWLES